MELNQAEIKTNRILLLFILLLDLIGFSLIFPVVPEMLDYYLQKASETEIDRWLLPLIEILTNLLPEDRGENSDIIVILGGILGSLYSLLQFIAAPLWGRLSDRIGRRLILILTSGSLALSYLIWFFSRSFTLFILSRILAGFMAGNLGVASASMADMSSRENRTKEMGLVGAAFGIGFIIGPALGGIAAKWNMIYTFPDFEFLNPYSSCALLSFIASAASAVLNLLFFKETLPAREKKREHIWIRNPITALTSKLNISGLPYIFLMNFLFILFFSGFEFTMTFFYKLEFNLTPYQIGFVFLYLGIIIAIGQGGLVRLLVPRIGEKKLAMIGFALIPLSLYFFSRTAPSTELSLLCLFPLAIGSSMIQPALTGLASLMAATGEQGLTLGVFRSAGSLARALGPIGAAYLYWLFGVRFAYIMLAMLLTVVFLLSTQIKDIRKTV